MNLCGTVDGNRGEEKVGISRAGHHPHSKIKIFLKEQKSKIKTH